MKQYIKRLIVLLLSFIWELKSFLKLVLQVTLWTDEFLYHFQRRSWMAKLTALEEKANPVRCPHHF